MENQGKPQVSAVHARFALSFPVLFFLSLGAHVIGRGGAPTVAGFFAGAIFAALFSALISRSTLTILSISIAAVASQFMVHGAFHYVRSIGAHTLGRGHHHHGSPVLELTPGVAPAGHAMFSVPMLAAHLIAGVLVAIVLVQVDRFLEYLRLAARRFAALLRPVVLIGQGSNGPSSFFPTTVGIHVFLAVLTKRGPPRSLKPLSI